MVLFARYSLLVLTLCALGLAPHALIAANLLSHTTYTDTDGNPCQRWVYDDGSELDECSWSETEIIEEPAPALTEEAVPEGFTDQPSSSGDTSTPPEQGDYKPVPEDYGRKAREEMQYSKERAKEHLGYEEVISEPAERDPDFGKLGDQIRNLGGHLVVIEEDKKKNLILPQPLQTPGGGEETFGGDGPETTETFETTETDCCETITLEEESDDMDWRTADGAPLEGHGYRKVLLPEALTQPSKKIHATILPFKTKPYAICCDCKLLKCRPQGETVKGEILHQLLAYMNMVNSKLAEEGKRSRYGGITGSDPVGVRQLLAIMKEQMSGAYDERTTVRMGRWSIPDIVIDGELIFKCCEPDGVRIAMHAEFHDSRSGKLIEGVYWNTHECLKLDDDETLRARFAEFVKKVMWAFQESLPMQNHMAELKKQKASLY
ncbi:MAG: hypothetical protein ISR48_05270 [Alphaproteobacteria bacterium]|nr:hypothetical protein [Alphaproteobacteria bacterium]